MSTQPQVYPRADFQRSNLRWSSLNGPWDFIYDDEDVGLSSQWQLYGLPSAIDLHGSRGPGTGSSSTETESITKKIAALPDKLLKDNSFQQSSTNSHQKQVIQVPFVFQAPASGLSERGVHEVIWYERHVTFARSADDVERHDRTLLRFNAVDYEATVWVNGALVGGHRGGHVPFELDITDAISSQSQSQRITIRVFDSAYDLTQPRGKQYWGAQPESIFYTPSSGIWQSVWLETVPSARIADSSQGTLIRSDDIESGILHTRIAAIGRKPGYKYQVEIHVGIGGVSVASSGRQEVPKQTKKVQIDVPMRLNSEQLKRLPTSLTQAAPPDNDRCWRNGLALWSPEHPLLYDITIRLFDASGTLVDDVRTTTGMRSLSWKDSEFRLNGRPYFHALVLDQGYWPGTLMTPPHPDSLRADIEMAKKMGFNGCRKHQKVEDPLFLYWADRLGYLVWGEMANGYQFSDEYIERFNQEWQESVKRDINHPSIVAWTPVNESWGYPSLKDDNRQRNHVRALYYLTKTLDPSRPINDNCGWEHVCTDLSTFHDYADGPELEKTCSTLDGIFKPKANREMFVNPIPGLDSGASHLKGAPVLCTEFGGVNIAPGKGSGKRDWGYTTASDPKDLLERFKKLVLGVVKGGHCCGFVYTQLADIEQEVNGLYSFDRKAKLEANDVKAVLDEAQRTYYSLRSRIH